MLMIYRMLPIFLVLTMIIGCTHSTVFPINGAVGKSEYRYVEHITEKIEIIGLSRYPDFEDLITRQTHIDIELELSNGGKLIQTQLLHSSGNPAIDAAMLDIIRYSAPYPPFPDDMKMETLKIQKRWQFMPQ